MRVHLLLTSCLLLGGGLHLFGLARLLLDLVFGHSNPFGFARLLLDHVFCHFCSSRVLDLSAQVT